MGLLWDLMQESRISDSQQQAKNLEERVGALEEQLRKTNDVMANLLRALEHRFGEDLDGDKRIG
jgi:CII-binding regulator of phage lambda lysogenization HflD